MWFSRDIDIFGKKSPLCREKEIKSNLGHQVGTEMVALGFSSHAGTCSQPPWTQLPCTKVRFEDYPPTHKAGIYLSENKTNKDGLEYQENDEARRDESEFIL